VCDDIACGADDDRFPSFERGCVDVLECYIAMHMVDCCGTLRAMGISADEETRFLEAEAICVGMYPACGCASNLSTADDGTTSVDGSPPRVDCLAGVCTTTYGL
jgi:hypothetical protein